MAENTASTKPSPKPAGRRRASRAAGPAAGSVAASTSGVPVETPKTVRLSKPAGPPPRKQPHRTLVALVALVTTLVAAVVLGTAVFVTVKHQRGEEAEAAESQLFVDTASQFVVNMFSYTQQTIDA